MVELLQQTDAEGESRLFRGDGILSRCVSWHFSHSELVFRTFNSFIPNFWTFIPNFWTFISNFWTFEHSFWTSEHLNIHNKLQNIWTSIPNFRTFEHPFQTSEHLFPCSYSLQLLESRCSVGTLWQNQWPKSTKCCQEAEHSNNNNNKLLCPVSAKYHLMGLKVKEKRKTRIKSGWSV